MKIPNWPYFDENDVREVSKCLLSGKVNYWTGNEGKQFEIEFSKKFGTNFSIALANGTLALNLAYRSLELQEGDEFITTPRTFIATTSAGVNLKATPLFADVDRTSGCITSETIEPLITSKTKLISVVHLGGWPADMYKIMDLAKNYNLKVVEDCSQAHGALFKGKNVGSFGDASTWSFCQDKIMSTGGEGGMFSTNDRDLWNIAWSYKDHGKNWQKVNEKNNSNQFRWLHDNFGSNYRLTEMQSKIGRNQLNKLNEWHNIRKKNAFILQEFLKDLDLIRVPQIPQEIEHAWYKFYCYLRNTYFSENWNRGRILEELNKRGYPAFQGSCSEIYREDCFYSAGIKKQTYLPVARELGETSLMFLVHPTINETQMIEYAENIRDVILLATRC